MNVTVGLLLLHEQARVRLAQQRARRAQLAQLDQLQHHLLVQLHQLLVRQLQRRRGLEHRVPVPIVNVCTEPIHAINSIQGYTSFFLKRLL